MEAVIREFGETFNGMTLRNFMELDIRHQLRFDGIREKLNEPLPSPAEPR